MITKCANPGCSNHFLYMNDGKVFRFELRCATDGDASFTNQKKTARRIEFFWLCSNCAASMTVTYQQESGVGVQRLDMKYRANAA
jgi:hypothetical protein